MAIAGNKLYIKTHHIQELIELPIQVRNAKCNSIDK